VIGSNKREERARATQGQGVSKEGQSPSPLKERGTNGVRLINNLFPLVRGRDGKPLPS